MEDDEIQSVRGGGDHGCLRMLAAAAADGTEGIY